jgi:hypothetical protein
MKFGVKSVLSIVLSVFFLWATTVVDAQFTIYPLLACLASWMYSPIALLFGRDKQ